MRFVNNCGLDSPLRHFRVRYSTLNDDFLQSMHSMGCDIVYLRGRVQRQVMPTFDPICFPHASVLIADRAC